MIANATSDQHYRSYKNSYTNSCNQLRCSTHRSIMGQLNQYRGIQTHILFMKFIKSTFLSNLKLWSHPYVHDSLLTSNFHMNNIQQWAPHQATQRSGSYQFLLSYPDLYSFMYLLKK